VTYKAYIDNIKAKTGKSPDDFLGLAKKKGFVKDGKVVVKHGEILTWLKGEMGLGHGHANAIILYLQNPELAMKKIAEDAKREKAK
jgi:hypothetical protein